MMWIEGGVKMKYLNDGDDGSFGWWDLEGLIIDRSDMDGKCEVEEPRGRVGSICPEPEWESKTVFLCLRIVMNVS